MDDTLVRQAKRFARRSGKSVSGIVGDLFATFGGKDKKPSVLPPLVRSLRGALTGLPPDAREDYRKHLSRKHR
jgi:hypothetical protein